KPIIGISKADQNAGAVDQRVRGQTSMTRLPFPSKRIDPSQRVADRRRGGAVTKLTAPAPSCSIIELRLVRYSRERLGRLRSTACRARHFPARPEISRSSSRVGAWLRGFGCRI